MILVRGGIGSKSREEVRDGPDSGVAGGAVFGGGVLRGNVAERWSGLEELEELGWEFVGHGGKGVAASL